jgi:hypothetical protein
LAALSVICMYERSVVDPYYSTGPMNNLEIHVTDLSFLSMFCHVFANF